MDRYEAENVMKSLGSEKMISNSKGFLTNCPLKSNHQNGDRNPSMQVFDGNPTKVKCFACGYSGKLYFLAKECGLDGTDLIEYIDKAEGWEKDPVKALRSIKDYDSASRYKKNRDVLNKKRIFKDGSWFARNQEVKGPSLDLPVIKKWSEEKIPRYLIRRGITNEIYDKWGLGYDPVGYHKYGENNNGWYWISFGPRVIFIVYDCDRNIVGWSGRTIYEKEKSPTRSYTKDKEFIVTLRGRPKYYHLERFKKEKYLYGMHMIDKAIRTAILVEGPMDALNVYKAGLKNALAIQGSTLSQCQENFLVKNFGRLILLPDGDNAGVKCMQSIYDRLNSKMMVKVAGWIEGKDPGDLTESELRMMLTKRSLCER